MILFVQFKGKSDEKRFHGKTGPQAVELGPPTPLTKAWLEAALELDQRVGDYNGQYPGSFSAAQLSTRNGSRCSTQCSYLSEYHTASSECIHIMISDPAMKRSNLHVLCLATARKILFEKKKAVGVEFKYRGNVMTVRSNREVILSAGAFGSSTLLQRSGVGNKKELKALKIPVSISN